MKRTQALRMLSRESFLRALQTKHEAFRTLGMLIKCKNFGRIQ